MITPWLHALSLVFFAPGLLCAAWVAFDVFRHPREMVILNPVWPYRRYGRPATKETLAADALYPFTGQLLLRMLAALAMSLSSVSVITNALRLRPSSPT